VAIREPTSTDNAAMVFSSYSAKYPDIVKLDAKKRSAAKQSWEDHSLRISTILKKYAKQLFSDDGRASKYFASCE